MWANRSICSYSDFNLAYVAEFQYKTGYATTKNGRYGNPQYTFFTNGIYFVQKELSSLRILSSIHKATKSHIFYDVGSTYAIDKKINHLHNDRVTNM